MRVKWSNVVALGLLTVIVIVLMSNLEPIMATLSSLREVGPGAGAGASMEDRTYGLMVLGLLLVTIVAVVKIVIHGGSKQP